MNTQRVHSEGVRRLKAERLNSCGFENMDMVLIIVEEKADIFKKRITTN